MKTDHHILEPILYNQNNLDPCEKVLQMCRILRSNKDIPEELWYAVLEMKDKYLCH